MTAEDCLVSSYISKAMRSQTVTRDEVRAWTARQAQLKNLREHSVNCFCPDCNDRWAFNH